MRLVAANFEGLGKEILARGYHLRFKAQGSSMLPFIRSGQVIQVAPVQVVDLRPGDVIFYRIQGGALAAHRLLKKQLVEGRMLLATRGDSLPASKVEMVETGQVLGRVVSVEWWPGLTLRIDAGLGRRLGLFLARTGFLLAWAYPPLRKLKEQCPRWLRGWSGVKPQAITSAHGSGAVSCHPPQT